MNRILRRCVYFYFVLGITVSILFITACSSSIDEPADTASTIADYTIASEAVLRSIPESYINTARDTFEVAYEHTSHGTHVSYGVFGLPGFRVGDETLFAVSETDTDGALYFRDCAFDSVSWSDLSTADENWNTWVAQNREWLEAADNANVDVWMWSWCDITDHSVDTYLTSMQTLIDEYGIGGSKIGTGEGKTRTDPVAFIFMTGHANKNANIGLGNPKSQAETIVDYCKKHGYYCLDYYSIDTHTSAGDYYEDAGDNGDSAAYVTETESTTGNFYEDWQTSHALGTDWYENRLHPNGDVSYGQHNTQHITANRKAFAFWWILARIAGWSGEA